MTANDAGAGAAGQITRYERVKQYLDAAQVGSSSNYQGNGWFWNLPLEKFLTVRVYGVRMIAPDSEDFSGLTPREVAEQGPVSSPDSASGDANESCCAASCTAPRATPAAGRGAQSGLIKGLKGEYPFDGSEFPPLMWGGGSRVPTAQIKEIEEWIDAGCPASDAVDVHGGDDSSKGRALGHEIHPALEKGINEHRAALNGLRVRKNINCMSDTEFRQFQVAIAEMRRWDNFPADQRSWTFWAQVHPNNCQHGWEQFLPWHRAYLYEMELRMQDWDPDVALPYWSWSEYYKQNRALGTESSKAQDNGCIPLRYGCWITAEAIAALQGQISADKLAALQSIQWDPAKPADYVYMSGPRLLAHAGITYSTQDTDINAIYEQLAITNPVWHRARWPGGSSVYFANYPSPDDISRLLTINNFYDFGSGPANNHFFGALENIHNLMHNFSGGANPNFDAAATSASITEPKFGDMTSGAVTAYDPIFWGHHSNVDRLWWKWQQVHPGVFADNPDAVLPPWHYTVRDMRSAAALGYEYSLHSTHFPTDSNTFMTRFKSDATQVPAHALGAHQRAEVRLHGIKYMENPGLVRVYLNDHEAHAGTHPADARNFVGEFHIFQGQCIGGPGHCEALPSARHGDQRARDRKTPRTVRMDATDVVGRLVEQGETQFDVHFVVIDMEGKPATNVLQLASVSLEFCD